MDEADIFRLQAQHRLSEQSLLVLQELNNKPEERNMDEQFEKFRGGLQVLIKRATNEEYSKDQFDSKARELFTDVYSSGFMDGTKNAGDFDTLAKAKENLLEAQEKLKEKTS